VDNNDTENPLLASDTSNNIVDGGIGVFPPEDGALEAGAKYLELPVSLTHSLTYSPTHLLTHSLTHSLIR